MCWCHVKNWPFSKTHWCLLWRKLCNNLRGLTVIPKCCISQMSSSFLYYHLHWKLSLAFTHILLKSPATWWKQFCPKKLFSEDKKQKTGCWSMQIWNEINYVCVCLSVCKYVCVCVCVCVLFVCGEFRTNFSTYSECPVIWWNKSTEANTSGSCDLRNLNKCVLSILTNWQAQK